MVFRIFFSNADRSEKKDGPIHLFFVARKNMSQVSFIKREYDGNHMVCSMEKSKSVIYRITYTILHSGSVIKNSDRWLKHPDCFITNPTSRMAYQMLGEEVQV